MIGLYVPTADLPPCPCVEILWRVARPFWGQGYATEAANAALDVAFEHLRLEEVVSFAVVDNVRSRAVMENIGMIDTGQNFDHPDVPESSPLREHCFYTISQEQWSALRSGSVG